MSHTRTCSSESSCVNTWWTFVAHTHTQRHQCFYDRSSCCSPAATIPEGPPPVVVSSLLSSTLPPRLSPYLSFLSHHSATIQPSLLALYKTRVQCFLVIFPRLRLFMSHVASPGWFSKKAAKRRKLFNKK